MLWLGGCWSPRWLLHFNWTKIDIVHSGRRKWLSRCLYVVSYFVSSDTLDHIILIWCWIGVDLLVLKYQILTKWKPIVVLVLPRYILLSSKHCYLSLLWLQTSLFIVEIPLILLLNHGIHLVHKHFRTIFFHVQSTFHRRKHRLHSIIFFLYKSQLRHIVLTQGSHPQLH